MQTEISTEISQFYANLYDAIKLQIEMAGMNDSWDQSYGTCDGTFLQIPTHNYQHLQSPFTFRHRKMEEKLVTMVSSYIVMYDLLSYVCV